MEQTLTQAQTIQLLLSVDKLAETTRIIADTLHALQVRVVALEAAEKKRSDRETQAMRALRYGRDIDWVNERNT